MKKRGAATASNAGGIVCGVGLGPSLADTVFDISTFVFRGERPALPLQPGEVVSGPHARPNGEYFLKVALQTPQGLQIREVDCLTTEGAKAFEVYQAFKNGRTIFDVADLMIGSLLTKHHERVGWKVKSEIRILLPFWSNLCVGDLDQANCRKFRAACPHLKDSSVRHLLQRLATLAYKSLRPFDPAYKITLWLPPGGTARKRWLRRREAARLLWAARGRIWDVSTGKWAVDPLTGKRLLRPAAIIAQRRGLARFILLALNTGSRSDVIRLCRWVPGTGCGYIKFEKRIRADGERSVFEEFATLYRQDSGLRNAHKRTPPVRIEGLLLVCLKGWQRRDFADPALSPADRTQVVRSSRGGPIQNMHNSWEPLRKDSGLGADVIRHTLRHTCATWMLEGGASEAEVADRLGVTIDVLLSVYAQVDRGFTVATADAFDAYFDRHRVRKRALAEAQRAAQPSSPKPIDRAA